MDSLRRNKELNYLIMAGLYMQYVFIINIII